MFHILRCQSIKVRHWKTARIRPFWRIYWNATPGALVRADSKEISCSADSLVCIPPGLSVEQTLVQPFEHFWMHVDTPFLADYELKIYEFPVDKLLVERIEKFTELYMNGEGESIQAQTIKQLIVYWFLSGLHLTASVNTREVSDLVKNAIQIMEERIQSGISTLELASILGVSAKTLSRQFKKYIEMPPHKFFTSLRIKKATALLFSNKMSLDEISYECGFCNRSHFSRAFRDCYNESPAAFRRDQST
ncbi:MAG: helix-turn-helix domain-containing protein [Lentisphaeraceae bacterium]|nr:helix-turn-helix domain-containing protein [Lentisphaeraceae bacterium]